MSHPAPSEIVAVAIGDAAGRGVLAHLRACEECRRQAASWANTLTALGEWRDEGPPEDGLARVLAAVAGTRPAAPRAGEWRQPVLLSLLGVLGGGALILAAGTRVVLPPALEPSWLRPLEAASGFVLAALAFFGAGSLVTLALAPMLILELQRQRRLVVR